MEANKMYTHSQNIIIDNEIPVKHKLNIVVAQKDQKFTRSLKEILTGLKKEQPLFETDVKHISNVNEFNKRSTKNTSIVFIEDRFLLELGTKAKRQLNLDIVLLFDGHFVGIEAFEIKKIIQENSLNLVGHISLTNYPYDLIRLLVMDFIKVKFYESQKQNT